MWGSLRSFFAPPIAADPAQTTTQLTWIVRLRWLALGAQILSIFFGLEFNVLEPSLVPAFVSVIGLLAAFNLATWFVLRRGRELPRS